MKRLALAVIALALLWSGWWVYAARALGSELDAWFDARRGDGWEAEYADRRIRGFPNRLDVTFTDLVLADPDARLRWEAPFFQILQLAYARGHEILVWPPEQSLRIGDRRYDILSDGLRASLVHDGDGIIDRSNLEAAILNVAGPDGGVALAGVTAGLQAVPSRPEQYRLALVADRIAGPEAELLPRPDSLDALSLRAEVGFDAPWTLDALRSTRPQPREIDLRQMDYAVDGVAVRTAGRLQIDAEGRADGELSLRIESWRALLDRLRLNPDLGDGLLSALEQGIGLLAGLRGSAETLDLTLRLDDGQMAVGLIPLGPAPRVRLP